MIILYRRTNKGDPPMTQTQQVIKSKIGLFELAKQLGDVSQACKILGYSGTASIGSKTVREGWRAGAAGDQPPKADIKNRVNPSIEAAVVDLEKVKADRGAHGKFESECPDIAARNVYLCSSDELLRSEGNLHDNGRTLRYLAIRLANTESFAQSRRDRNNVRMTFPHLKYIPGSLGCGSAAQLAFTTKCSSPSAPRICQN